MKVNLGFTLISFMLVFLGCSKENFDSQSVDLTSAEGVAEKYGFSIKVGSSSEKTGNRVAFRSLQDFEQYLRDTQPAPKLLNSTATVNIDEVGDIPDDPMYSEENKRVYWWRGNFRNHEANSYPSRFSLRVSLVHNSAKVEQFDLLMNSGIGVGNHVFYRGIEQVITNNVWCEGDYVHEIPVGIVTFYRRYTYKFEGIFDAVSGKLSAKLTYTYQPD